MPGQLSYFGRHHKFSHFHPAPIELYGMKWGCPEQLYQYSKAIMAHDMDTAEKIQMATTGAEQKSLSKRIRSSHLWDELKEIIMTHFDYQKFEQNPEFRNFLLGTGNRYLLENNPYDRFWGPPRNAAGKVLMNIRDYMSGRNPEGIPNQILLGDSMIKHVNLGWKIRKISLPGANMGYLRQASKFVAGPYVKQLVVFGGTNDQATRQNKDRLGARVLIKRVREFAEEFSTNNPKTQLVICQILNRPQSSARIDRQIILYNEELKKLAPLCQVLEIGPFPDDHFSDGLHLSKVGTEKLEMEFKKAFGI